MSSTSTTLHPERFHGTFDYACECGVKGCRRTLRLTHRQYLQRREQGPFMAARCAREATR